MGLVNQSPTAFIFPLQCSSLLLSLAGYLKEDLGPWVAYGICHPAPVPSLLCERAPGRVTAISWLPPGAQAQPGPACGQGVGLGNIFIDFCGSNPSDQGLQRW